MKKVPHIKPLVSGSVFIIAEIGMNHNGSLPRAKELIYAAAECGADAVKFQTHIAEAETLPDAPPPPYFNREKRYDYFKRTAFTLSEHLKLKGYAQSCAVEFISSPFSLEAVDLLEEIGVRTYKIASGEVSNIPLLKRVAKTGKRVLLSSGMSTWKELSLALRFLKGGAGDIVLMQCTSVYPCPAEKSGLNVMCKMQSRYKLPVGFSDHTTGIAVSIAAVTLGASVIEKHFTLSKRMYGPDAKNSATPVEFKALVGGIRDAQKALVTQVDKDATARSLSGMKFIFEKSIVAAREIPEGTMLTEDLLAYKKPGDGIPAAHFEKVIGKKSRVAIQKNQKIRYDMLTKG
jgi:N,N'-diacetyllegionaminate synthase